MIKLLEIVGLASGLLAAAAYFPYAKDILSGNAKPERASWLIWSALGLIAFFTQLSKGATVSLWFTGFDSIITVLTFILSIKFGFGGLKRRDVVGLAIAAAGLIIWYSTKDALWALLIVIGVDATGTVLSVIKTYEDPSTETYTMWLMVSAAAILAMASVGSFNFVLLVYPFYIFLANFGIVVTKFWAEKMSIRGR
jgi:hypothetical protein